MQSTKEIPSDRCLKVYKRPGIYPHAWNSGRVQKIMLGWSEHCCENCGVNGNDVLLHVHHIIWNDKHDCRFQNLVVVCVACHVKIHNHKWQPGRPWTLTETPEWMTVRGYKNIVPVKSFEKPTVLQEAIAAQEKHIQIAIALQEEGIKLMQSIQSSEVDTAKVTRLLKDAINVVDRGAKMEREAWKTLLQLEKSSDR